MLLVTSIAATFQKARVEKSHGAGKAHAAKFENVYDDYFAFVWRQVRALGVPPALVDDAVQEVFIVINRRLDDFEPKASIRSWIFGIVRRVAKDFRRSAKRSGIQVAIKEEHLGANTKDPYKSATQTEALRVVEAYLGKETYSVRARRARADERSGGCRH